jgi:copper ion binding protein
VTTETLSVPDISCDHCQRTIESTLGRLPGVRAAAVDVATRTVRVTYDETALDHAAIASTLADEGYEVARVPT